MAKDTRYSIITDNLERCVECGSYGINKHEIFYGTGKRKLSIKYGLVIPLCQARHHNQYECKGIHFDTVLCEKWHKIGQKKAMEHYNWTIEDFIRIFGRNYLD